MQKYHPQGGYTLINIKVLKRDTNQRTEVQDFSVPGCLIPINPRDTLCH